MAGEQIKGEEYKVNTRMKFYVVEVKDLPKGPKILLSRSRPELVKRLFEAEVAEIKDGTVEIKAISSEAGSRTKMAVCSHDENVDAVGACVGAVSYTHLDVYKRQHKTSINEWKVPICGTSHSENSLTERITQWYKINGHKR